MKKHRFFILGLSAAMLFTACRKNDVQVPETASEKTEAAVNSFRTLSTWESQPEENYTVNSTSIADAGITASVASKGLVLVYKKTAKGVEALPQEEQATGGSYFWYYQVSEGQVSILADTYGKAAKPGNGESFAYFVIPAEKLDQLEAAGHPKSELMTLTYENAAALLK